MRRIFLILTLLTAAQPLAADDIETLSAEGEAHYEAGNHEAAIAAYSQVIEIDPTDADPYGYRAQAYEALEQFDQAAADLSRAIALDPEDRWALYRLGRVLNLSGDHEAALAITTQVTLDHPNYRWGWYELARAHLGLGNPAEAGAAFRVFTRFDPFNRPRQGDAFLAYRDAGMGAEAAFHGRLLFTMDPNQSEVGSWLDGYLGDLPPPILPPHPWASPPEGREMRYFSVNAQVDSRSEMEIAIAALQGFFRAERLPLPESGMVYRMSQTLTEPDWIVPVFTVEHRQDRSIDLAAPLPRFRGLLQLRVRPFGPDTPVILPRFGETSPADIWPLSSGNGASGQGVFFIDCAQARAAAPLSSILMGCVDGIDTVDVGTFDWSLSVSTETVHVPMGIFDTYRLDAVMEAEITLMGRTNAAPYTASYWFAPELETWVASIFTVGDRYIHNQAMEIVTDD